MVEFTGVGDRVWVLRHPWFDLNVTAVGGERGLLVIDTHASARAAREVVAALRRLGAGDVVAVANTHVHVDHTFGNGTFRQEYGATLPLHAHETVPEDLPAQREQIRAEVGAEIDDAGLEMLATEPVAPDHLLSAVDVIDLGDRIVELMHPGRGHTRGDVVAVVPDADVLVAGDLVEESGPPGMGPDCWPLEWPGTLDLTLGLTTPHTVVVPGHGAPVDRVFVQHQATDLGTVAQTISDLAGRGVGAGEALATGEWPWDPARLADAVRRGYAQLPPSGRRLPMA